MLERIQKILSSHGVASRRAAEAMIADGRVTVNGVAANIGDRANPSEDEILVDGKPICKPEHIYIMLYKPRGVVTTLKDEKNRRTVRDLLPPELGYLVPAGRLDLSSEGLLIMTNDGDAVNRLTHPSGRIDKSYLAWVQGDADEAIHKLTAPISIDGVLTRPARVRRAADNLIVITIHEGKNRQVRLICENAGLHVTRLKRVSEGKLELGDMRPGQWRHLSGDEISYIRNLSGRNRTYERAGFDERFRAD